jgi:hypothetical protein
MKVNFLRKSCGADLPDLNLNFVFVFFLKEKFGNKIKFEEKILTNHFYLDHPFLFKGKVPIFDSIYEEFFYLERYF